MSFAASYTPSVVRLRADGVDLDQIITAMHRTWGASDPVTLEAGRCRRASAAWVVEVDDDVASLFADLFEMCGLGRYERVVSAAVKRYRADELRAQCALLEEQAAELEREAVA